MRPHFLEMALGYLLLSEQSYVTSRLNTMNEFPLRQLQEFLEEQITGNVLVI